MMSAIKTGPHAIDEDVTDEEKALLRQMYMDGTWPWAKTLQTFGEKRSHEFMTRGYFLPVQTDLGRLTLLLARGLITTFGVCDKPAAFSSQIDRTYFRLALQQLGWTEMPDQSLVQHDPTRRMRAVYTRYGPALVMGLLGSGTGMTLEAMRKVLLRQKSSALYHGYRVVLITPSARRGQKLASKHRSWFHVVHCLPKVGDGQRLNIQQERESNRRPSVALPDRAERVEQALQALQVDTVLSRWQLERYYGLNPTDLAGVPYVETVSRPVHARYGLEVPSRIYLAEKRMARLHDHDLIHRAGVAEIRHQLGAPADPNAWEVEARGRLRYEEPDAVWRSVLGEIAIEYDTGSYTMKAVDKKVETFRDCAFIQTIWGTTSDSRAARLSEVLGPQGVQVMTAKWWQQQQPTEQKTGVSA